MKDQFTTVTDGGNITITGYTGKATVVSIPEKINGLPVTAIGDKAFSDCSGLDHVSIPASVISIGDKAFEDCSGLTRIRFMGTPPSLGTAVFPTGIGAIVYYSAGVQGWGPAFGGLPTQMSPV